MIAGLDQRDSRWTLKRPRGWVLLLLTLPVFLLAAASWRLTEPLADRGATLVSDSPAPVAVEVKPLPTKPVPTLTWPQDRVSGEPAKSILLDVLSEASERLNMVKGYTATFRKQERINGTLGPEQTLAMKVRHQPFAIYFKFLAPRAGKEVVYAEGHHDNKLIAHAGAGLAKLLVPRFAVAPDHPLALADSRHPVTEAGLVNLTARLLHYRRKDMDDSDAVTLLDRTTDAEGRPRLRSVHTHPKREADRPFARVVVLYDPETFFPVDIRNYDWPAPDQSEPLNLVEHYGYDDLDLDATLTALDFDPANPAYAFHRY